MIDNAFEGLTPFEVKLIDFVSATYCNQFPERTADTLRWEKTTKGEFRRLFFFYSEGIKQPIYFAKTASDYIAAYKREAETLSVLDGTINLANTIPQVLGLLEDNGNCALIERANAGWRFGQVKLWQSWKSRKVRKYVEHVFKWWMGLVDALPRNEKKGLIPQHILNVRRAFLESHGETNDFPQLEDMLSRIVEWATENARLSVTHGDLWSDNILYDGRGVFVVDWERADEVGFPLLDALLFLSTLVDDGNVFGMDDVFFEDNWLSRITNEYLLRGCSYLGLSRGQAEDLFFYFHYMMSAQTMRLFELKTPWDTNWYLKLEYVLRKKDAVKRLFLALPK